MIVVYLVACALLVALAIALGFQIGRAYQQDYQRQSYSRWQEERIMADLTRIDAAVQAILAYVATLKATQEDPAVQAKLDTLATQLEGAVTPPA